MKTKVSWLSVGMLLVLTISVAPAQHRGHAWAHWEIGGPPTLALLGQESVQSELQLSDEQAEKVAVTQQTIREDIRKAIEASPEERQAEFQRIRKESEKLAATILDVQQAKRVQQIRWQLQGTRSFANPEVADALKLTDTQKEKIKAIHEKVHQEITALFKKEEKPSREEVRRTMVDLHKKADGKIMELLSDDQKVAWKGLAGEPFKGTLHYGPAH
jgi:hypothetical protein